MLRTGTLGLVAWLSLASAAEAEVLFVKPTPTGVGDCGSWADACALIDAINSAASGDEVWVRSGVYGPIDLKDGVKIIGGFAGNETSASQSNPLANVTALDGGRSVTVVIGFDNPPSTVLRGFHIRNGDAGEGGGMLLANSSPTVVQCVFENNQASSFGAAVSIRSTQYPAYPRPRFVNCEFRYNGKGTSRAGGHPYGGGAVWTVDSLPTFVNCLFHHNKALEGGAIFIGLISAYEPSTFVNCTFAYNTAFHNGGAIWDIDGYASLYNCILWGNVHVGGQGFDDHIYTGSGGTTDVRYTSSDNDPLFENSAADDYSLQPGSPCIDTANNVYLPADEADLDWDGDTLENVPYDLALRSRTLGIAVDKGAYEAPFCGDGNCEADENSCNCSQDCGLASHTEQVDSTCNDDIDNDCDTLTDCDDPDCNLELACMGTVPTVSAWGLVILALLLLTGAKVYFGHQPGRAPTR